MRMSTRPYISSAVSMIAWPPAAVATGGGDLTHHVVGRTGIGAVTGEASPLIVDDNLRPPRREQHGVGAAEPSAAPGDDRHPAVESQVSHLCSENQAV